MVKLRLSLLFITLIGLTMLRPSFVLCEDAVEPSTVAPIRKACHQIDAMAESANSIKYDGSIAYLDDLHNVRKIQGSFKGSSKNSNKEQAKDEWLFYYDADEVPLFSYRKGTAKSGERRSQWENRFYFLNNAVTAWKKGNDWVSHESPTWESATTEAEVDARTTLQSAQNVRQDQLPND